MALLIIGVLRDVLLSLITFFVTICVIMKSAPIAIASVLCDAKRQAWQGSFKMRAFVYRMLRRPVRQA